MIPKAGDLDKGDWWFVLGVKKDADSANKEKPVAFD